MPLYWQRSTYISHYEGTGSLYFDLLLLRGKSPGPESQVPVARIDLESIQLSMQATFKALLLVEFNKTIRQQKVQSRKYYQEAVFR